MGKRFGSKSRVVMNAINAEESSLVLHHLVRIYEKVCNLEEGSHRTMQAPWSQNSSLQYWGSYLWSRKQMIVFLTYCQKVCL